MARLVCEKGPLAGQTFEIDQGLTIGRGTHNSLPMPKDRKASRDHAKLWRSGPGKYTVADLGSTNGTLVNDGLATREELSDGDMVQVGEAVFRFELDESEKPKPKAPAGGGAGPAAGRASLADVLRGDAGGGSASGESASGAPAIVVKERVLQYSKKGKGSVDVSQTAGTQRLLLVLAALAVFGGLFYVVKEFAMGTRGGDDEFNQTSVEGE